jgi:Ca-activated chloride channel homolog
MMHFASPLFLWLLLLVPMLAAWWLWQRRRAGLRHPVVATLHDLPLGKARLLEALRLGLWLGVIVLLVIALARPRWPDERTRIATRSLAIMMVLDVSGSMAEKDFVFDGQKISRLDAAKHAFRNFLEQAHGDGEERAEDQIGLLTFAARAEMICPPTLSRAVVLRLLDEAQPVGVPPDSSTNIGDAVAEAIGLLQRAAPQEKIIVLLTDGEHNVPESVVAHALNPRQAGQVAAGLNIRVHTIFAGPADDTSRAAESALQDVARMTSGRAFRAADGQALQQVCADIAQLERARVQSFRYYRYHEGYPWVGLACLVFSMTALLLEGTRGLRVP